MGFQSIESLHKARFNSSSSCEFLDLYEQALDESILAEEEDTPSKTFAPSQIRCKRISWFRLRGVAPEKEKVVDRTMSFTAQVGTACHQTIQEILSKKLGKDWIDVSEYIKWMGLPYKYTCYNRGYETKVEIFEPVPIKFAPDGIIFWKGKYWLLEIKTSDYQSFEKLTDIKPQHLDQVRCYCTLLRLNNALVLYQDRVNGTFKCYEVKITKDDMNQVWSMFSEVQDAVAKNIPPAKLPKGDTWCTPSRCRYFYKCKEW